MPTLLKQIILATVGFSSGMVISGAVFAFISIIGIVPRLAQKTKTKSHIKLYEEAIIFGGIFGSTTDVIHYYLPIGKIAAAFYSLSIGVFIGCLAICLTEILNVIPILSRRAGLKKGLCYFLLAIALGKMVGSLLYFVVPGFFVL